MTEMNQSYRWFWATLGLMVVLRLIIWLGYQINPDLFLQPDSYDYRFLGAQLFDQGVFNSFSRTPVYPLFIGFLQTQIGLNASGIALVQIAISLMNALLVFRLFQRYWLPRLSSESNAFQQKPVANGGRLFVGMLSLVVFGLDFVSAQGANYLLSETLFTALLLLSANWLMDVKHDQLERDPSGAWHQAWFKVCSKVLLSGVCLGLAILCRPIAVFLPLIIVFWGVFGSGVNKRQQVVMFAIVFVISSLFSIGWMARNYEKTGAAFLTTISSINLYEYRAAWNVAQRDDREFEAVQAEFRENKAQLQKQQALNEGEIAKVMGSQGLAIIASTPVETVLQGARGFVHLYFGVFGAAIDDWMGLFGIRAQDSVLPLLVKIGVLGHSVFIYLGVFLLLICLAMQRKSVSSGQRSLIVLCFIMVGYFTVLSVGIEAYARFRIPMLPFLGLLSVVGWAWGIRYGLGRRTPWRISE